MKKEILRALFVLVGALLLLTGCESVFDQSASDSPAFPPAPLDKYNAPNSPAVTDN
jgi:hypothetical protein